MDCFDSTIKYTEHVELNIVATVCVPPAQRTVGCA